MCFCCGNGRYSVVNAQERVARWLPQTVTDRAAVRVAALPYGRTDVCYDVPGFPPFFPRSSFNRYDKCPRCPRPFWSWPGYFCLAVRPGPLTPKTRTHKIQYGMLSASFLAPYYDGGDVILNIWGESLSFLLLSLLVVCIMFVLLGPTVALRKSAGGVQPCSSGLGGGTRASGYGRMVLRK